jgi:hypothetical protein
VQLGIALVALLQNEEVRRALRGASAGLRGWADRRRSQLALTASGRRGPLSDSEAQQMKSKIKAFCASPYFYSCKKARGRSANLVQCYCEDIVAQIVDIAVIFFE